MCFSDMLLVNYTFKVLLYYVNVDDDNIVCNNFSLAFSLVECVNFLLGEIRLGRYEPSNHTQVQTKTTVMRPFRESGLIPVTILVNL